MRILVVEDDDSMRRAISRLLGAAGHENASFATAEALLKSDALRSADYIISDIHLPAMSGFELLARLRLTRCLVPVILITAFDGAGLRRRALEGGASAYLPKPFAGSVLLDAIQQLNRAGEA